MRLASWVGARRFGVAVSLLVLFMAAFVYASTPTAQVPVSDGFYSWIFARSLAFDADVDFSNDYALCGDPFGIGIDRGTGHPDNIFYPGPSLFWIPILWLTRFFLGGTPSLATCGSPWTSIAFATAPVAGAGATYLSYVVARRFAGDGVAALATAFIAVGGPLLKFSAALPSYSHVYDAFCTSALVAAALWATREPGRLMRWSCVALVMVACVVQRLSNVAFVLVPIVLACSTRAPRLPAIIALLSSGALVGVVILGAIYQYLYGSPFVFTHGPHFLHFAHAHPFLLLFDMEEGLVFTAPASWLSAIGLLLALRSPRATALLAPLIACAGVEFALSAAALDWSPARRLTNLLPLMAALATYPLALLQRFLSTRRALVLAGTLAVWPTIQGGLGSAWGYHRGLVASERPLSQRELYGGSLASYWALLDETVGAPFVWPAQIAFELRYGLPASRFGEAAFPRWYLRDFRSLGWIHRDLSLSDPLLHRLMIGLVPTPGGARFSAPCARLVFGAQWPYATHITVWSATQVEPEPVEAESVEAESVEAEPIEAAPVEAGRIQLGAGRAWRPPLWFGDAQPLRPGNEFVVPSGGWSSGINELVICIDEVAPHDIVLQSLRLDDRRQLEPLRGANAPLRGGRER